MNGKSIIMTEQDIRELLENLGSKVSMLAEENRVCNNRDDAGRQLISLLENYLEPFYISLKQTFYDFFKG